MKLKGFKGFSEGVMVGLAIGAAGGILGAPGSDKVRAKFDKVKEQTGRWAENLLLEYGQLLADQLTRCLNDVRARHAKRMASDAGPPVALPIAAPPSHTSIPADGASKARRGRPRKPR